VWIAHAKAMLIDGKVKLLGSMNWSKGAGLNSEDLNLVVSPEVAETYAAHWRQRLSASVAPAGAQTGFRRQAENRRVRDRFRMAGTLRGPGSLLLKIKKGNRRVEPGLSLIF